LVGLPRFDAGPFAEGLADASGVNSGVARRDDGGSLELLNDVFDIAYFDLFTGDCVEGFESEGDLFNGGKDFSMLTRSGGTSAWSATLRRCMSTTAVARIMAMVSWMPTAICWVRRKELMP
jgi:hypothetical protein